MTGDSSPRYQRFAGTDARNGLADVNSLASLTSPDTIVMRFAAAYSASRLTDRIDWQAARLPATARSLLICGHSDFAAIRAAGLHGAGQCHHL